MLFDGRDDDITPIRDTSFIEILHRSEGKNGHLMRLVLHRELKREALCLCGASSEQLATLPRWKFPDEDYSEEKNDAVEFYEDSGVLVTSLFVKQDGSYEVPFTNSLGEEDSYLEEGDPFWELQDKDYLEYLVHGHFATTYVLTLDPKGSRDKQEKAVQRWLKMWKRAYPSQKKAGGPRSVKGRLIDLACWRLWRRSRWCNSDEGALAKEVGSKINGTLPTDERLTRLDSKHEIKRRCRTIWPFISARLKKT